jgi:DNA replication protein DnaC
MGSRAPTEAQAEAGLALLNARSGSPTVITSNLSMEQIGRIQDDRLASRLGAGLEIRLTGKDRRLNP